jgi:hypothetical protein
MFYGTKPKPASFIRWQANVHGSALPGLVFSRNAPAVRLDQMPGNR